jgi:hypothetical protein
LNLHLSIESVSILRSTLPISVAILPTFDISPISSSLIHNSRLANNFIASLIDAFPERSSVLFQESIAALSLLNCTSTHKVFACIACKASSALVPIQEGLFQNN